MRSEAVRTLFRDDFGVVFTFSIDFSSNVILNGLFYLSKYKRGAHSSVGRAIGS